MRLKLILILFILFQGVYAQESKLKELKQRWEFYSSIKTGTKELVQLQTIVESSAAVVAHPATKDIAESWSYRAMFASLIAYVDTLDNNNSFKYHKIAKEAIDQAVSLHPSPAISNNLDIAKSYLSYANKLWGSIAYNKNDFNTAHTLFSRALEENPNDTLIYTYLGYTAMKLQRYNEAIDNLKRAISMKSVDAENSYEHITSMLFVNLKDTLGGMKILDEALSKYPQSKFFLGYQTDVYVSTKEFTKAEDNLGKLLQIDPDNHLYFNVLGDVFYNQAYDLQGEINELEDQKKYYLADLLIKKRKELLFKALPYYIKVVNKKPNPDIEKQIKAIKFFIGENYVPSPSQNAADKKKKEPVVVDTDNLGPQITILSPNVSRGLKVVESKNAISVMGIVKDESGISKVEVNGVEVRVDDDGNFIVDVPLKSGDNSLQVHAIDGKMNKSTYSFVVNYQTVQQKAPTEIIAVNNDLAVGKGRYYALIIGVQEYTDETIPDLENPIKDAALIYNTLTSQYNFSKENSRLVRNPTRDQLFKALDEMASKVKAEDNLLIFYAGHGNWDDGRKKGYWYPADAVRNSRSTWISNEDITEYISSIPSKHTLLITDACYSGSIFKMRSLVEGAPRAVRELYNLPSRKAMTSGTMGEVPDKSIFLEYLIKRLTQNTEKYLTSEQLFSSFRTAVINNSPNNQVPQFGEIRQTGDEGGDFIFIRKN